MERKLRSVFPMVLLIIFVLLGMYLLMSRDGVNNELLVLCVGMCVLSFVVYLIINLCDLGDTYLYLIVTILATVGIIMTSRISIGYGLDNMKMYLGGVALFFITILVYRTLYKHLKKLMPWYFLVSVVLYIVTLFFAAETNGARNWIKLGPIGFQPTEFIKILFIMTIAGIITYRTTEKEIETKRYTSTFGIKLDKKVLVERRMYVLTAITYINMLFLMAQKELGTAVVLFAVYLAYLFVYDKKNVLFLANAIALTVAVAAVIVFVDQIAEIGGINYVAKRIYGWQNPYDEKISLDGGWSIINSLREIKGGGFLGNGIGNGALTKLEREALGGTKFGNIECDYIFAAICNEMGVLGGIAVLMLYFVLVYRGYKIALSTTNHFNKAVAFGVSTMLGVQTFVIIGGVTKLIPLTGITLPFISHGGSSMLSTFIAVGLLQAISSAKGDITDELE